MKLGLTAEFPCSYLPDRKERLLVYVNEDIDNAQAYDRLIQAGFRRSGEQIYRPHCAQCNACKAMRINVELFKPSKGQKRIRNKNRDLNLIWRRFSDVNMADYYPLYANYISERHRDGSMYPPDLQNFLSFNQCLWRDPYFLEAWLEDELVAVAITDKTHSGLSAFYTFFEPKLASRSLGKFMILAQFEQTLRLNLPYTYLGYYIADCEKMNYKNQYAGYEWFNGEYWTDEAL